ncbi:hypothetical protein ACH5RR_001178 [Cinchona calisaya]|uniref:Uncharacterized protein n=1 Tax=Cinchona calisaya TaxID=153742 RepID=A0ABD3B2N4_9GENT
MLGIATTVEEKGAPKMLGRARCSSRSLDLVRGSWDSSSTGSRGVVTEVEERARITGLLGLRPERKLPRPP